MDIEPPPVEFVICMASISGWTTLLLFCLLLIGLLFCSALISASEVAFFSLTPRDIDDLKKDNGPASASILALKEEPKTLLATILVSNNFINIAIVILSDFVLRSVISEASYRAVSTWMLAQISIGFVSVDFLTRALSVFVTVVAATFLLVFFGEVAPKIYANLNNIRHAKLMAKPLLFLSRIFYPINSFLIITSNKIEHRVYSQRLSSPSNMDKKELDKAIDLAVNQDEDRDDVDILKGIIKFGDVTAKQIMKSRVDVVSLDIADDYKTVMDIIKESGYSRLPVYENDIDSIKGILYVKDLLGYINQPADFEWNKLIRKSLLYVPESKKIDELLKEFQQKRNHMAIVVDEYGGTQGLVTLEDIMEEVIGDIKDEFDQDIEVDYVQLDNHNFIFDGKTLINDMSRILDVEIEIFDELRGSADSIAGLLLELEGKIPHRDKVYHIDCLKLKVISVNKRRIEKIHISKLM